VRALGQLLGVDAAELLERTEQLSALHQCYRVVTGRLRGPVALVSGEAGIGKTTLLHRFCHEVGGGVRVLWGACDPLFTPRPLGPVWDIAAAAGGELEKVVAREPRPYEVVVAMIEELRAVTPAVVVVEDAHWADEATLDVIRLLANRLGDVGAMLVISYRDDELGAWHPLRILIGELGASRSIVRVRLGPLSAEAVAALAEPFGVDAERLYARTGGNPFFVSELLEGDAAMPASVSDAVLARAGRLDAPAREALEAVAVAGPAAQLWVVERLQGEPGERLDRALASGLLVPIDGAIKFRHELAREAVLSAIGEHRKMALHRSVLEALRSPPWGEPNLAWLAHHAVGSRDANAALELVPAAATRASRLGAHREAAELYDQALRFAQVAPIEARAALFGRLAVERWFIVDFEAAELAQRQAMACYEQVGDELRQGAAQSWLAELSWQVGSLPQALELALEAAAKLKRLPAGRELVDCCCRVAQLLLAAEDPERAREWAQRAQELAEQVGSRRASVTALMTLGWVGFFAGEAEGLEQLEHCIQTAETAGLYASVVGALVMIVRTAARRRMYDVVEEHLQTALDYCDGRDFDIWRNYLIGWQAKLELARCHWDRAAELAQIGLSRECPFSRIHALVALGLTRARRGDPDPWTVLDEALELALPRQEFQWIGPVAAARAEAAWLEGRYAAMGPALQTALGFPMRRSDPYATALAYWYQRAGLDGEQLVGAGADDDPYLLQLAGDSASASRAWQVLGCPYEAALALADSDDQATVRQALERLQQLGARPAAAIVARRLREQGARGVPRGPRPSTRGHPSGLTARELEVLALLAEGLRNAQIAQRLVVAPKTVDHHVSAILRKLDVRTRGEASAEAIRLGLAKPT
jgi:DNA-binding CsgD family transcriptional regulator/tetratricopeptide (TPR) repeat protein